MSGVSQNYAELEAFVTYIVPLKYVGRHKNKVVQQSHQDMMIILLCLQYFG